MKQIKNFMTSLISFYITFSLNLEQEKGTLEGLKPVLVSVHQTALLMWGFAVLNDTQISLVCTLQKSLRMMTIVIVKYSSYRNDRLSRQTVLDILVTCLLSDSINFFYGKYVLMHFGLWHAGHTYKTGTNNQEKTELMKTNFSKLCCDLRNCHAFQMY